MAPLAVYLAGEGHDVRGWDDGLTEIVRRILAREGVRISRDAEFPEDADVLVYSSAIASSHPILRRACKAGVPTLKRGEMLAQQAKGRRLVAIVGSHGKTTTAAMIAHILNGQGFKAGFVGGGLFNDDSLPPAWNSSGKWLVAEIDESDGSIEHFSPEITLLTNLDWDHPDQYNREEDLQDTFRRLFARTGRRLLLPFSQADRSPGNPTCNNHCSSYDVRQTFHSFSFSVTAWMPRYPK